MLRTVAINSNQIVLSFGVLIAFWSPKQFKNEGELYIVYGKAFGSSNSWRTKLWSLIVLCLSRLKYARKEHWREENRVKKTEDSNYSLLEHFWSTSRSPFATYYIPFQSSGSQESNASNGVRIGAEWGRYGIRKTTASSWRTNSHLANLELQRAKVILQLANLELNVRKWIPSCEINLRDFHKSPCSVRNLHANWDICAPTLLDLFFRYFCINFHSSPCNPRTIRFLN